VARVLVLFMFILHVHWVIGFTVIVCTDIRCGILNISLFSRRERGQASLR